jgi:hypothetical protein
MKTYQIILALVVASALLYAVYIYGGCWREHYDRIAVLDLPQSHRKKTTRLLLHYGSISLDQTQDAQTVKSYAEKQQWDYYNCSDVNVWATIHSCFESYKYEYILIVPVTAVVQNPTRSLDVLLRQAGDVSLILSRAESQPKRIQTDIVIFRIGEWTTYKLHQLHYWYDEQQSTHESLAEWTPKPPPMDLLLDQLYTPHVHKTFEEFTEYLTMGIPYMLTNICVFHEHALWSSQSDIFRRSHPKTATKVPSVLMYPWSTVRHPRFTTLKNDAVDKIDIPALKDAKIPKVIFQTMETHLATVNIRSCIEQVQSLNTEYKYYYFNAYDCRVFIQKHYPKVLEAYDTLLPGAYKADLWRYCVLHKYGGFYLDSRMYPYLSFDSVITKDTEFMSCIDGTPNMLYQAILGVAPDSALMQYAIDECVDNIKRRQNRLGDLAITGPRVMGRALNKWLNRPLNKDLDDIDDKRVLLLRWNSVKIPKYLMLRDEMFACHKYTKLFTDKEIESETTLWLILTGKEHYSSSYRNNRIYKDTLFK